MKLDVKELLNKFLYMWEEWQTANTADTWVPVFVNGKIQHRVIPYDNIIDATKVGNVWTGGSISAHRKGNCCVVKLNGMAHSAVSARTTIASLPVGYRPSTEITGYITGTTTWGVRTNGEIWIDPLSAQTNYANVTYCV